MGLVDERGIGVGLAERIAAARARRGQRDGDVLEHRELVEQVHELERARDAEARDRLRRAAGDVAPSSSTLAAVGLVAAGQHVEAGGLAGAVRAHDARQAAGLEGERDVLQHDAVAEAQVQVLGLEQRHRLTSAAVAARRQAPACARACRRWNMPAMPFGLEQHQRHEQQAEPQHPAGGERADHVAGEEEHDRADHRPPERDEAAADQRHHHDVARVVQAHDVGEGRGLRHGEQAAGEARTGRPTATSTAAL